MKQVFLIMLLSLAWAQFLDETVREHKQQKNPERVLVDRSREEGAYLAALVLASLIVTIGISWWVFIQVFRQERKEVYSNLIFEIPDFKAEMEGVSGAERKEGKSRAAKRERKNRKGKANEDKPQRPSEEDLYGIPSKKPKNEVIQEEMRSKVKKRQNYEEEEAEAAVMSAAQIREQARKKKKEAEIESKDIDIQFDDPKDEDLVRGQSLRKAATAKARKVVKPPPEFHSDSDEDNVRYVPKNQRQKAKAKAEQVGSKTINDISSRAQKRKAASYQV